MSVDPLTGLRFKQSHLKTHLTFKPDRDDGANVALSTERQRSRPIAPSGASLESGGSARAGAFAKGRKIKARTWRFGGGEAATCLRETHQERWEGEAPTLPVGFPLRPAKNRLKTYGFRRNHTCKLLEPEINDKSVKQKYRNSVESDCDKTK